MTALTDKTDVNTEPTPASEPAPAAAAVASESALAAAAVSSEPAPAAAAVSSEPAPAAPAAYICVTYALSDREFSDRFCRELTRYGFRFQCVHDQSDAERRRLVIEGSSLLIALTSVAAEKAETIASDIRLALGRRLKVLCVSLDVNGLDLRFGTGATGGATLIPAPVGATPDRHSLALFHHRLYVRHLARLKACFSESVCARDLYGRVISCAYRAHGGDDGACYELGRAYELGDGVPALENEAAYWINLAAEQDHPNALIRMGMHCLTGRGTPRNTEAAFRLFTRAAELGDVRGDYRLGLCYLEGHGVMKDPVRAVEYLERAAKGQYAPALYRLGLLYRDGIGTAVSYAAALKCLYAACKGGFPLPEGERTAFSRPLLAPYRRRPQGSYVCISLRQWRRLRLYETAEEEGKTDKVSSAVPSRQLRFGRGRARAVSLPEDRWEQPLSALYGADSREEQRLKLAANRCVTEGYEDDWTVADAALAALELGRLVAAGGEGEKERPAPHSALIWYRYAAGLGSAEALFALGDAYRRGLGTPMNRKRAVELYRLAAAGGSVMGQFALGVCYERGIGVTADPAAAFRAYEMAADMNYPPARNNLGGCYEYGVGVASNPVMAVEQYAQAANADLPEALCRLGTCYETGTGVTADADKAIRLYTAAVERGNGYACYRLALWHERGSQKPDGEDLLEETETAAVRGGSAAEEEGGEREPFTPEQASAIELYRRAAEGGVAEAAYALCLCYRDGRGVEPDPRLRSQWLTRAAEGGCLQACYERGMDLLEGRDCIPDRFGALAAFRRAAELWYARTADPRWGVYLSEREAIPPAALSAKQAVGQALYMLGYCTLYASDDAASEPSPEAIRKAAVWLEKAAAVENIEALTMIGDLYTYGLLKPDARTPEEEAYRYYLEADRLGVVRRAIHGNRLEGAKTADRSVDALMSLAARAERAAASAGSSAALERACAEERKCFYDGVERGSADAHVRLAACLFHGRGTPKNTPAALRLLRRAESMDGGRLVASLWLGDHLRSQWGGNPNPKEADRAYLRALETPSVESECGAYTLRQRRAERKAADEAARAEVYYRIATLRAVHFSDEPDCRESFAYLAEAVLRGHKSASEDLARIFAYGINRTEASEPQHKGERKRTPLVNPMGKGARLRRRMKREKGLSDPVSHGRAARVHNSWMADYYTAYWPEPLPFSYTMRSLAIPEDTPRFVTAEVTDLMRMNAMQYLGECYFEGHGLPENPTAAVACYRAVTGTRLQLARGEQPPASYTEATYSLGWCLLYGVGTERNEAEAVKLLSRVAKNHAGAAYTMGVCHEEGRGVVAADAREAVKFFRKAQKLGHPGAAEKVEQMESLLKARSEEI